MSGSTFGVEGTIAATSTQWNATTVAIGAGQLTYESDTGKFKLGNGSATYSSLPYIVLTGSGPSNFLSITSLATATIAGTGLTLSGTSLELVFGNTTGLVADGGSLAALAGSISAETTRAEAAEGSLSSLITSLTAVPILIVAGNSTSQSISNSFTTVQLPTLTTDTNSGWNSSTYKYTIPMTGTYLIVSKLRWADGGTSGIGFGQGVNTSNVDGTWVSWFVTNGIKNASLNNRIVRLTAGTVINMYAYANSALTVYEAELDICLIAQG